jgi:hypothetical protein
MAMDDLWVWIALHEGREIAADSGLTRFSRMSSAGSVPGYPRRCRFAMRLSSRFSRRITVATVGAMNL